LKSSDCRKNCGNYRKPKINGEKIMPTKESKEGSLTE
jgi:hypothetical protein